MWQPREWYEPANVVAYAGETADFTDRVEDVPVRPLSAEDVAAGVGEPST